LDFFRRGLPNPQKISFLGGPAHFVTYGGDDGDGLVDNNNALTTMASALKINVNTQISTILTGSHKLKPESKELLHV
jgi:hypothetical protein